MKKILISMLLLVPILAGCASVDTKITINNDRSASIATSVSYEGDLSDKSDITALLIHENYSNYLDNSWQVDKAFNSKLSTIIATKKVNDLSFKDLDLSSLGFVTNLPAKKFIEYRKSFLVKSFNIDCTYDLTKEADKYKNIDTKNLTKEPTAEPDGLKPEYYQRYINKEEMEIKHNDFFENMDETVKPKVEKDEQTANTGKPAPKSAEVKPFSSSITIQLPAPAFYNNADSVEGTLYTWNIKSDKPTNIKLQYVQYNGFAIFVIIITGIILLILGARKIIKHENQKRIGSSENLID